MASYMRHGGIWWRILDTGLNVIYSGTGEVVTVTPSQVRSETSSETLKLNIQLRVTSTPPPASTLLLVTDPEYHIIDLRRCSAPCRWVQDTRLCLSSAICAVWTLQRINTAAADQIDEEKIIYCAVIHPFNLRLFLFVLIYHMHIHDVLAWKDRFPLQDRPRSCPARSGGWWPGPSVAQWDSVRHIASKCCGVVVLLLPMLQVMACCAACCWIHAGFGFSEYFIDISNCFVELLFGYLYST